jgi:hypothetical protein
MTGMRLSKRFAMAAEDTLPRARPRRAGDHLRPSRAASRRHQQIPARPVPELVQALPRQYEAVCRAQRLSPRHRTRWLAA